MEDENLRKDLNSKFITKQNTEKELYITIDKVTELVRNKKDPSRFISGWKYVNENISDKDAEKKLRRIIVER